MLNFLDKFAGWVGFSLIVLMIMIVNVLVPLLKKEPIDTEVLKKYGLFLAAVSILYGIYKLF